MEAGLFAFSDPVRDGYPEPDAPCWPQASTRRLTRITNRDGYHEEKGLSQGHRHKRGGRGNLGRTGDRAVDAGDQVAHADELAEVARHAVWRRRHDDQVR